MSLQFHDDAFAELQSFTSTPDDPLLTLAQPPRVLPGPIAAPAPMTSPRDLFRFYGFTSNPFADCVDPNFFFRTAAHSEAVKTLMLAVEFESSLGLLTGPSGMGKTLVSQLLLQQLDPERYCPAVVLVTPGLGKTGLLREILAELSVALPMGVVRVQDLVKILANHIIELHEQGKRLVLIVDESHFLSAECLHIVRTISNIEVPARKLVTCLLFGESRLSTRLAHPSYEALRNRIYLRGELGPLGAEEAAQYVKYRLMMAGRLSDLFTEEALAALHHHSGGVCRGLNKLGLLTLIEGVSRQCTVIEPGLVESCVART